MDRQKVLDAAEAVLQLCTGPHDVGMLQAVANLIEEKLADPPRASRPNVPEGFLEGAETHCEMVLECLIGHRSDIGAITHLQGPEWTQRLRDAHAWASGMKRAQDVMRFGTTVTTPTPWDNLYGGIR